MRELLGIARVGEAVGRSFSLGGADVVPLPHPSGASGWLNDAANRGRLEQALGLLQVSLQTLNRQVRRSPEAFR